MLKNRQIWVTGFLATAVYLLCTTVAYFNYPLAYTPLANWLSDLGNPLVNPNGAFSYNLGCVLSAIVLIFFYLGLDIWKNGDKKRGVLLAIAQVAGILSSLFLIVSAFFPLGAQTPIHSFSGKAHIFFVGFFLTFSGTALLRLPEMPKWLAYFAFLVAVINFIYGAILREVFIAEWAAIGLFIVYVLLISGISLQQNTRPAEMGASR